MNRSSSTNNSPTAVNRMIYETTVEANKSMASLSLSEHHSYGYLERNNRKLAPSSSPSTPTKKRVSLRKSRKGGGKQDELSSKSLHSSWNGGGGEQLGVSLSELNAWKEELENMSLHRVDSDDMAVRSRSSSPGSSTSVLPRPIASIIDSLQDEYSPTLYPSTSKDSNDGIETSVATSKSKAKAGTHQGQGSSSELLHNSWHGEGRRSTFIGNRRRSSVDDATTTTMMSRRRSSVASSTELKAEYEQGDEDEDKLLQLSITGYRNYDRKYVMTCTSRHIRINGWKATGHIDSISGGKVHLRDSRGELLAVVTKGSGPEFEVLCPNVPAYRYQTPQKATTTIGKKNSSNKQKPIYKWGTIKASKLFSSTYTITNEATSTTYVTEDVGSWLTRRSVKITESETGRWCALLRQTFDNGTVSKPKWDVTLMSNEHDGNAQIILCFLAVIDKAMAAF